MLFKIISAGLAAVVVLSGCGAAEDTAVSTPAVPDSGPSTSVAAVPSAPVSADTADSADAELRKAVQAYSDAFLTGDAKAAYDLLSERCRKRRTLSEFTAIVSAAKELYGSALPLESYSAKVSDDLARVTYTYAIKAIDQEAEPWTREAGDWHQDDC